MLAKFYLDVKTGFKLPSISLYVPVMTTGLDDQWPFLGAEIKVVNYESGFIMTRKLLIPKMTTQQLSKEMNARIGPIGKLLRLWN